MSCNTFITDSFNRLVHFTDRWFVLVVVLTTGIVSCSQQPNITSAAVHEIGRQKFSNIDWSPDDSTLYAVGSPYPVSAFADLYFVEVASGNITKLTDNSDVYDFPTWSPDGEDIAITVDQHTIWIFNIASRNFTYLTAGEGATWLPEGDKLAIYVGPSANDDTDHREIRIVDLQGNILRTLEVGAFIPELLQLQPYLIQPDEDLSGFDISPDGEHLIFSLDLYTGMLEGEGRGEQRQETYKVNLRDESTFPFLPGETVGFVSWSPDGNKIAYIQPKILGIGKLIIVDNQGKCQMIPDLPTEIESPSWSKDGSQIAFLYGGEIHILDTSLYLTLEDSGCP